MTVYLSVSLVISLTLSSAPEAKARQRGGLPRPTSAQPFVGLSLAAQDDKEVRALVPGTPVERELAQGETHSYSITLTPGQYMRLVIEQRSVNVGVKLFGPGDRLSTEVNNWNIGLVEQVSLVAEVSGEYRIEVRPVEKDAASGRYELKIEELRGARPQDRSRVAAERVFADGQLLRAQQTAESRRQAIQKYEESLPLWRAASDIRGEAEALSKISEVSHELSENRTALERGEQALLLWRAVGDRSWEAGTLNRIGLAHWALNEYQKALEYFRQALPLDRATGNRSGEASTLHSIGIIYSTLSEYQKALEHYGQALSVWREIGNGGGEAVTLNNMGVVYNSLGEYQKALECYDLALPLRRATGNRRGEGYTLANIGDVYNSLGEYHKALQYYDSALSLSRAVGDRRLEGTVLNNIGKTYDALGDYQKAKEHYGQALALYREVSERRGEANTLSDIGSVHHKLGEYQKASDNYNQALSIRRAIGDRTGEALSLNNIGLVTSALGDSQKALEYLGQALVLRRAIRHRKGEAMTLFGMARAERNRDNLVEARARIEAALEIIESLRTNVANQELRASFIASVREFYDFYTDLLMQLHQRQPSAGHDNAALVVSERSRARSLLETLAEARSDIRQGIEPALLERERGLQQQVNLKAERLPRLLGGKHTEEQAVAAKKELDTLLSEYHQVQAQIRKTSPQYAALTQPQPLSVREIQQRVLDQDSLLLEYSLGKERSFLWAVTPTSMTSYVLPKQAEIETAARRVYELLTARNHHPPSETPEQRAARVNQSEVEYAKTAAALSQMLLGSVATQLGTKRLIIVGEDALQYVPFGALPAPGGGAAKRRLGETETRGRGDMISEEPSDRRVAASLRPRVSFVPLIAKHEIVTLPSASVLAVLRRELLGRASAPKAVAVLADPVFRSDDPRIGVAEMRQGGDEASGSNVASPRRNGAASQADVESSAKELGVRGFKRLRFSRQEAEAITAIAPGGKSLKAIDFAANRATATSLELSRYRVLHFATHGLLNSQHPELSGIVLSMVDERGHPQDGFLRLHEIYNLKLGADLVVLSACQTALGKEIKGEGLIGLTRGFMYAGAPRVVASLWNVDDRATAELMKRFYEAMFIQGMRPAAALRAGQTSLRREKGWAAAYYWAGFTLQGEWR